MTSKNVKAGESASTSVVAHETSEDIRAALETLSRKVVESRTAHLHALLTLNHLLRLPNAQRLFTDDLRQQGRELWLKVKSAGFQLEDPPLLFPELALDGVANGGAAKSGTSSLRM